MFEMILSLRIKYDKCIDRKNCVMRTIHHFKQISIRPVFLCFPLNFCIFLSSNLVFKKCDNNPSGSRKITYLCTQLSDPITNSNIGCLNPLNDTLLALSHAWTDWTQYWYKKVDRETARFTTVVQPSSLWWPNWQTPGLLVIIS